MTTIYAAAPPPGFESVGTRLDLLVVGWVVIGLIALAIASLAIGAFIGADEAHYIISGTAAIFIVLFAIIWIAMMVPFQSTYQRVYRVTGHVESVSNVLTEDGGDLTRMPVVVLDTLDRPVVIDDPRAVTLTDRDVTLTCRIEWHRLAADTYTCSIYDLGGDRS